MMESQIGGNIEHEMGTGVISGSEFEKTTYIGP